MGLAARERRVAPPTFPGPLYTRRLGVAGRFISARAASPLGSNLPGHSRHDGCPWRDPSARSVPVVHVAPAAKVSSQFPGEDARYAHPCQAG